MAEEWAHGSHGPLVEVDEDLFIVTGEISLLPIGRVMTIVRLGSGELLVHSAVAASPEVMAQIDDLGPVKFLVVPSASHKMDAPRFKQRYPAARVLTPERGRSVVQRAVAVDGNYGLLPGDPRLSWQLLDGVPAEGVFLIHHRSGSTSLVFNDALMNLPDRLPGLKGWLTRVIGSTGGPKVTPTARRFIVEEPAAFRRHLERLAQTPELKRVIVGHGAIIDELPAEVLLKVAATL